jgi:hypothetical protein
VFDAVSNNESFQDVHMITLKGEFVKKIESLAIQNIMRSKKRLLDKTIQKEMLRIIDSNLVTVQAGVHCNNQGIFVVVNADTVNDVAVDSVVTMVSKALNKLDGACGVIKFGEPVSFHRSEIPWLNIH